MKAGWKIALAFVVATAGMPLLAFAGHGHGHHGGGHHGGGYAYGGGYGGNYGGACGCGAQVQAHYAPPAGAQFGQPTPAVAQRSGGYQSFSYSPEAAAAADVGPAAPPVMSGPAYQAPAAFAPNYYGGYSGRYSNNRREARAYNNAANKSLGNHDYGIGR